MKVLLLVVGKTEEGCWKEAMDVYSRRLVRYIPFETVVINEPKKHDRSVSQLKEREGRLVVQTLEADDCCILLDERGQEFTSREFASYIEKKMLSSYKRLVFVAGGPYGFSDEVYARVMERLSLSKMTFSHQMVRPVFVEQLYRAMTILHGGQYHHD